ncbi:polysaccharide deacetylase family protein [Paenibacillus thermotolerans]|uniref:polysaccharide deacetylase family protein n=1 Tax=Paenibacillus thermotolerans TaxID=3027807 RepID=UPI002367DA67|nr:MULTISPECIES: polysaccharide deacetylase family protein [unclassified Paenibacillus]
MRNKWKKTIVILAFAAFSYMALNQAGSIAEYVASVKTEGGAQNAFLNAIVPFDPAALKGKQKELYDRIAAEAEKRKIEPINARVDRVWKAIPGLNGEEVDIERTFKLAMESKRSSEEIVYVTKPIPPAISLDQLGAYPIYKGNPRKPMISLMINVAWGNEYIPGMLETLRKEKVKATFFLDGKWLKNNPDIAKQIMAEGHEMSNHAYSHKNMSRLTDAAAREEIVKTQDLLKNVLGVDNKLFAPPSGDFDQDTVKIAHELGLKTVLWTIDTVDWKKPPAASVVRKISARLEPGSLILMHPTESASGALPGIIAEAKRRGFAISTVSDTLSPSRTSIVETPPGF